MKSHAVLSVALAVMLALFSIPAQAQNQALERLAKRLLADGFSQAEVSEVIELTRSDFDPAIMASKIDRVLQKQFEPLPPPTGKTLQNSNYRQFLSPSVLADAASYQRRHADTLAQVQKTYGAPPELVVAFMLVETKLGSYLGRQQAVNVLGSMAACDTLDAISPYMKRLRGQPERVEFAREALKDRNQWAYEELKALMVYAKRGCQELRSIPGSIYGAIGACQFMPTNAIKFGSTGGDNVPLDLFNPKHAMFSIGAYLRGHGWREGIDEAGAKNVIYAYNHSNLYVLAVWTVAEKLKALR